VIPALGVKPVLDRLIGRFRERVSPSVALFTLVLAVYLATRLVGLTRWPIYFFTDEAVQTVMAADFVRNDFKNYDKEFLPTYFSNGPTFNLSSVSVYAQVLPYLLFGKSEYATRAVSVLIGLLAALAIGLTLRDIFKIRFWWSGVLLLSITPAWFLHSRTAFETVELTAFYALFLYFYLMYRYRDPRYLFASLPMGALVFYTYSPGLLIMLVSGVLLLLSDLPYHWKQRKYAFLGLLLLIVLALPYMRYTHAHPGSAIEQLRTRAPYWVEPGPFIGKLKQYFTQYRRGFNLYYWFVPNHFDLDRHLMKGYGHLFLFTAPFMFLGLATALWNFHSSGYRAVLIALLAAPSGSALVQIGITRALVMVIPVTLLVAIGLAKVTELLIDPTRQLKALRWPGFLAWMGEWGKKQAEKPLLSSSFHQVQWISPRLLGAILFVGLVGINVYMLGDVLISGPTWFQQYDMGGMQYGASQLFGEVKKYAKEHPDVRLLVSSNWANGTDVVKRFFVPDNMPVEMGSHFGYEIRYLSDIETREFVVIPAEWEEINRSGKFMDIQVDKILNYPNGKPGFYFVRLRYVDNIQAILTAEKETRRQLQEGQVMIDGEPVKVRYSLLDGGSIEVLFDGNTSHSNVARTMEANPFVVELIFSKPRTLNGLTITIGGMEAKITARLYASPDAQPVEYSTTFNSTVKNTTTSIDFTQSTQVQVLHVEVLDIHAGEPAHIHVTELQLR
jgi:hypothetical protein